MFDEAKTTSFVLSYAGSGKRMLADFFSFFVFNDAIQNLSVFFLSCIRFFFEIFWEKMILNFMLFSKILWIILFFAIWPNLSPPTLKRFFFEFTSTARIICGRCILLCTLTQ